MNLYISDLHFGHSNAIRFDNRPFKNRDEMDHTLIKLWNGRVYDDDHVYIVGDFMYKSDKSGAWYLRQLKGHKHLIIGNHDRQILNDTAAISYFESIDKMMHVEDYYEKRKIHICLCHYPMVEWYKSNHGTWHIFGHIHGKTDATFGIMRNIDRALNAGACINNYTPSSFTELVSNNLRFNKDHTINIQQ